MRADSKLQRSSIPPSVAHSVRTDTSKLNSLERDVKILSCSKYTWMIIVAEIKIGRYRR